MKRSEATLVHLLVSIVVGLIVLLSMYFVWYPSPYFLAAGGAALGLLIISVDVILGPLITLTVFNPKKKTLKMDMTIVIAIQAIALIYGLYTIWIARPAFIVAMPNYVSIISALDVDPKFFANAKDSDFRTAPLFGPRIVGALPPKDPDEQLKLYETAIQGGADLDRRPDSYRPMDEFLAEVEPRLRPLGQFLELTDGRAEPVQDLVRKLGIPIEQLAYLPVKARSEENDFALIVDRSSKQIVDHLRLKPWIDTP